MWSPGRLRSIPATTTLQRLIDLSHEVDFAAFVFARDDWTTDDAPTPDAPEPGQASPRDNVVFEAGLFGSALGMRRTFILHANGAKLPSDLLGLTSVRYDPATTAAEVRSINQKLRTAIESEGRISRIEGIWWQFSLTERSAEEPSAVSLLRISRGRDGALEVAGRGWQEDGTISVAVSERGDQGEVRPVGRLLLLERRTASGPQRTAARRNGRDPHRGDGSRGRVLDDSIGQVARAQRTNLRGLSCAPIPRTWPSSTGTTIGGASSSSRNGSNAGNPSRAPDRLAEYRPQSAALGTPPSSSLSADDDITVENIG